MDALRRLLEEMTQHGLERALVFDLVVEVLDGGGRARRRLAAKRFSSILGDTCCSGGHEQFTR